MSDQIQSVLKEDRVFPPAAEFSAAAHHPERRPARADPPRRGPAIRRRFWAGIASDLHWFEKWDTVLDVETRPFAKWFRRRDRRT
jgi:acetyl-CoA synthetase